MKRHLFTTVVCLTIICLFVMPFVSCGQKIPDDVRAVVEYMQWFDEPEKLPINKLEKAEFDDEIMYYIDRGAYNPGDNDSTELIVVFYKSTNSYKTCFFLDMQFGLNADVMALWDKRDTAAKEVYVFNDEEKADIVQQAVEYCQENPVDKPWENED